MAVDAAGLRPPGASPAEGIRRPPDETGRAVSLIAGGLSATGTGRATGSNLEVAVVAGPAEAFGSNTATRARNAVMVTTAGGIAAIFPNRYRIPIHAFRLRVVIPQSVAEIQRFHGPDMIISQKYYQNIYLISGKVIEFRVRQFSFARGIYRFRHPGRLFRR